ncbi:PAS domain-containing protein [Streptomyces sp. RFCAC02]|uniref:PAS domain-containing protein n=1 Tax=Streptomyces sp. RFCAC02 TaxID=2499143 RepID=UPI001F0F80B4|nr:PAS domain-containing protein [Streptomyces sp. RFCAC02]
MGLSSESGALDRLLTDAVRDTGAYGAALYLLDPTGRLLLMTAITGLPADVAEPWHRVDLDMPSILADTVRLERLHWRNAPLEEAEGRQAALTSLPMPYAYATAHVPLACGDSPCSGALVVLWPPSHAALTPGEHAALSRIADRMGTVLRRAADAGTPETAGDRPREVPLPRDRTPDPALTLAAADFAERLPEGALALRLDGSTSWASATAADLLGTTVRDLLDARPWDVLPWLCTPACTDRYRAALLTREPTSFTAVRPPDHRLRFQFYPGAHGLSVRVTPTSEPVHGPPASGSP